MADSDHRIDRELAERGCALVVGTVGPDGAPYASRGWGLSLTPTTTGPVRLLLNAGDETTLANLRRSDASGGRIAVTGADVVTLRSFQVKGRVTAVEPATDDDEAKADRYADEFFTDIEATDGTARVLTERLRPTSYVACTVQVDEAYDQTPGPAAGAPVEP